MEGLTGFPVAIHPRKLRLAESNLMWRSVSFRGESSLRSDDFMMFLQTLSKGPRTQIMGV